MREIIDKLILSVLSTLLAVTLFIPAQVVGAEEKPNENNMALNKPVQYSGVEGGKKEDGTWLHPQFAGEFAVDGNKGTRWSADKIDEQWLIVDLEKEYELDQIVIDIFASSPDYDVRVSTDGVEYEVVHSTKEGSHGEEIQIHIPMKGKSVRYIKYIQHKQWQHSKNNRLYGSSINNISAFEISDFELSTEGRIRVGTFNLAANDEQTTRSQSNLTKQFNLDVIGIQEVDENTKRNPFSATEAFKNDFYPYVFFTKAMDYQGGQYGIATISKLPMTEQTFHTFAKEEPMKEPRSIQKSVVEKDGHKISIYNMHLSYESTDLRQSQFNHLLTMLENDDNAYHIIMGDFNVDQYYEEWDVLRENYQILNGMNGRWLDSFNGVDSSMRVDAVDNIIISRNFKVHEFDMVETTLSDHNLLYAELEFLEEFELRTDLLDFYLNKALENMDSNLTAECKEKLQEIYNHYNDENRVFNSQAEITESAYEIKEFLNNLEFDNLALNKKVSYSGVEGGKNSNGTWKHPHLVGELVVDGDANTRWSADKKDDQWLIVDLEKVQEINDIHIDFHAESPNYTILVSQDGNQWIEVYHEENGSAYGDDKFLGMELDNVEARFIKYQQNKMWQHQGNKQYYGSSIKEISVYKSYDVDSITLLPEKDVIQVGTKLPLIVELEPKIAEYKNMVWEVENKEVARIDEEGNVVGLKEGETKISIVVSSSGQTASMNLKVVKDEIPLEEILLPDVMSFFDYEKRFVEYTHYPSQASVTNLVWEIEDENIATVNSNGLVEAKKAGKTNLLVKKDGVLLGQTVLDITVEDVSRDYHVMTNRWLDRVVGPKNIDKSDEDIKNYVEKIDAETDLLLATMNRSTDRSDIWDKIPSDTVAANYTTQMNKIKNLALSFGIENSRYYQNQDVFDDIVASLHFMIDVKKYNGKFSTGNWWDWQIGVTQPMVDILFILDAYIDSETMAKFTEPLEGYAKRPSLQWPSYTATGANRTDIGITVLGSGVLARNEERIQLVVTEVPDVMKLVTRGDGIYQDGGIVQHSYHAYLGSYGNELVKGIGRILSIMDGTQWEIKDERVENVYLSILEGYIPLMHRGKMLSNVNGRSISRAPGTNPFTTEFEAGSETISNVMLIAQFAPKEYQEAMKSALKYWLQDSIKQYGFYEKSRDFEALMGAKNIMNDERIKADSGFSGMKIFNSMDRVVKETDKFKASVSGYSSRIANYEYGNTENKHGWHTGSGVLYVYNNDLSQFDEGYWPTVDPYHLPGTTVDIRQLKDGTASNIRSPQSWVGGVTDGENGAWGMFYNASNLKQGMDLIAQKSYFFFDDVIVNLGANINGTSPLGIDTTIENREIKSDGSNSITINGKKINKFSRRDQRKQLSLEAGSWIHLEGNTQDSDMLYYFPEATELTLEVESREGAYSDINEYFVNDINYTKTYFKLIKHHGTEVQNDSYVYVLAPGVSLEEASEFVADLPLEVVENSKEKQVVKFNDYTASNIWEENGSQVDDIMVDKASSLLIKENEKELSVHIADPRQNSKPIAVSVNREIVEVMDKSEIVSHEDFINYTFNVDKTYGESHHLKLRKHYVDKKALIALVEKIENTDLSLFTQDSVEPLMNKLEEAKEVIQNSNSQEEVDQMLSNLHSKFESLIALDYTKLIEMIEEIEQESLKEYTVTSVKALKETVKKANDLINHATTQEEIETMMSKLQEAYNALEKLEKEKPSEEKPSTESPTIELDYSKLEALITSFHKLKASNYEEKSYKSLLSKVQNAESIYKSLDSQEAIDNMVKEIEESFTKLEKINSIDLPATGMGYPLLAITGMIILIIGMIIKKKRVVAE